MRWAILWVMSAVAAMVAFELCMRWPRLMTTVGVGVIAASAGVAVVAIVAADRRRESELAERIARERSAGGESK